MKKRHYLIFYIAKLFWIIEIVNCAIMLILVLNYLYSLQLHIHIIPFFVFKQIEGLILDYTFFICSSVFFISLILSPALVAVMYRHKLYREIKLTMILFILNELISFSFVCVVGQMG